MQKVSDVLRNDERPAFLATAAILLVLWTAAPAHADDAAPTADAPSGGSVGQPRAASSKTAPPAIRKPAPPAGPIAPATPVAPVAPQAGDTTCAQSPCGPSQNAPSPPAAQGADSPAPPVVPAPMASPTTPRAPARAYIAQVLAANVVGGAATAYLGIKTSAGVYSSLAPYVLASPLVHVAHGNPGRATLSLLSRGIPILATLGGAFLDRKIAPCDTRTSDCDVPFIAFTALGFFGGLGLAGAIDVFLAQAPTDSPTPSTPPRGNLSLCFSTRPSGGGVLGVVGTF